MKIIALTAIAALITGCTTAEMVTAAKGECDAIGYAPGTVQHTECTERGYRGQAALQAEVATDLFLWALIEAAY